MTESREVGHKGDVAHKMTVKLWSKGICEKNEAGSSNTQYFIRHTGQFIYSKLDFLNCAFGVVPKNLESFETTADVPAFDCNEINPYFMFYTAIQPAFYKKNGIIADGSRKAKRIHVETFLNMPFFIPNLEEQNKIVDALSSLDHLITLHQRKCEETKSLKKYMLQKMFPENGKCVPKIRFKGYEDDWEQRKVSEIGNIVTGSTPKTSISDNYGGEFLFVSPADIQENRYVDETITTLTKKGFDQGRKIREKASLFVSIGSTIGKVAQTSQESTTNQQINAVEPYDNFDDDFIFTSLENISGSIKAIASNQAVPIVNKTTFGETEIKVPSELAEQQKIGAYFRNLDHLITLHQRKCYRFIDIALDAWEQRKLGNVLLSLQNNTLSRANLSDESGIAKNVHYGDVLIKFGEILDVRKEKLPMITDENVLSKYKASFLQNGDVIVADTAEDSTVGKCSEIAGLNDEVVLSGLHTIPYRPIEKFASGYLGYYLNSGAYHNQLIPLMQGIKVTSISKSAMQNTDIDYPKSQEEQGKIGAYFKSLDEMITLHQHKLFCAKNVMKYITTDINTPKKEAIMAELESVIEQKLIEQLIYGDSQWTYREDLKTEADLWKNFRYILEQNNKERLNGEPLSDAEFEQVKNQLQFSSFYKAGEWLVGENGKVMVHVQRDTERLHLVVMNHEHIAGGSSVYEVINQYNALKMDEDSSVNARDRRFDVTLMINGLPMIHIELKNKQHSYMDGFWQIKKYIGEGKFTGIFSAVQMFVISNGVDTKYFSAASDTELNPKFISGWLDKENNAVSDYLVFAKSVLRIPEAHEMIARYTVLDEEAKRLILLRPYQIHAIEAIRDASKTGKSGFVWHTTGSGKTLTSYKATRNLLMDIPAIDKAIFLIDRKDLDTQTTMAFQAYANNDLIDVDETDNVFDLKKKLKSDDRQVIVTTIQKLQRLITRKLQEGTPEYHKIKNLKIAFVVDDERVIIRTKLEKPSKIKGLALI